MNKKPVLVTRATLPPMEEFIEMLKPIWDSAWLTNMGDYHKRLERELSQYMDVSNLILFTNGHLALELLIQAMKLTGEVITTPFSFASTTHAIVRNNLTPVFCDINPQDYTIDVDKIESLITEKTSAILPVHVYGNLCDVERIEEIANRHHLKVIYDAAHTFGEFYRGKSVARFGDASMFSFHATKVYNTIEGGAVATKDMDLKKELNYLKNFGIADTETVEWVGSNAKMNEFQAAMGLCNLKYVDKMIAKRKTLAMRYIERLGKVAGLRLNHYREDIQYNYAYMPMLVDETVCGCNRDDLYDALAKEEIYARKYFYPCINSYDCYRGVFDPEATPIAQKISRQILTLPIYPELSLETVDEICDIILHRLEVV